MSAIKRERTAEHIQSILSTLLLREVNDPRLRGITITDVQLDAEMMYATVRVNALGDESRRDEVLEGLKRANGFLRREVGKSVKLRNTPHLVFKWDSTLESAEHLHQLLDKLDIKGAPAPAAEPITPTTDDNFHDDDEF